MKPGDDSEEVLFREARQRPVGPEREAYLDQACAGNQALRRRLAALLQAHESPDPFLEPPVAQAGTATVLLPPEEGPGALIGRYKILERIGQGGFGVVYVAEQREPIKRRVALKIIKLGMDTRQVVARFEAERQALALMDHPNIAKVLDAGATETGRPYFVMELVRGIPITHYCDQEKLATPGRLDLFIQVCHAIQHAHQKGIIHRDIKPSNILVTLHDGVPVPKVIDFGIAKATQQELTEKTVYTQFQQFIGTPAYMSPEQAEMSRLDIDTRSDIYSLGVLLYELLTGSTPFDTKELLQSGLDEMRKIIREREPVRPSTRLKTLADPERTTVAKRRHADPPQLIHLLRGDLDWIAMKCLEKDRARRYETANSLGSDVERFLGQEPVLAAPPSATYRAWKFIRRHRAGVVMTAALAGALAAGLGAALLGFAQARRERSRAETEAANARAVNEFLIKDFLEQASPDKLPDRDVKLRTVLDQAASQLEQRFAGKPLAEAEIREGFSASYYDLGEYSNAWFHLDRAIGIYLERFGPSDARSLKARHRAAQILWRQGRYDAAKQLCEALLPVQRRVLGLENADTLETFNTLARIEIDRGDWGQSRRASGGSLARRAARARPRAPRNHARPAHPRRSLCRAAPVS